MKLVGAFFKLVRWPNLVFIVITQVLFYYCIAYPPFSGRFPLYHPALQPALFVILIIASVLIAAAGYIINDYFDLNIDKINKPDKLVVEKIIRRRWAIGWHLILTSVGIILSFYLGYKINNWLLGIANMLSAVLLWFYSTTFKKKLLIGNIIISLLTAWVVLVIYFCELRFSIILTPAVQEFYQPYITRLFKLAILYAGFAFIISLVREVIKDIEDMQGDAKYGCKTMPIVWGVPASKVFAATWMIVVIASLVIIQFYAIQITWWWSAVYTILFIIIPCLLIARDLYRANVREDYHRLSSLIKLVMLTGIVSMFFFKVYA